MIGFPKWRLWASSWRLAEAREPYRAPVRCAAVTLVFAVAVAGGCGGARVEPGDGGALPTDGAVRDAAALDAGMSDAAMFDAARPPSVADNPPVPSGYKLMTQSQVTPAMTDWAVMILHDPVTYPMFSTTTKTFGTQLVLARVEWHPPDFQNGTVHRGVTLYVPV